VSELISSLLYAPGCWFSTENRKYQNTSNNDSIYRSTDCVVIRVMSVFGKIWK